MELVSKLSNLDNIEDGETRKLQMLTAGDGIVIDENNVISATNSGPTVTDNQILWGPDYYFMSAGNTINLSQKVSEQKTGIVLVWQAYSDNAPQPWDYNFTFIPKWQTITNSSRGIVCYLSTSHAGYIGTKYVYLFDDKIKGHSENSTGATKGNSGITTTNNHWVLTYVIGV